MPGQSYSKAQQVGNSPGRNRWCKATGTLKADCTCSSCIGSRNRKGGVKKQTGATVGVGRALGVPRERMGRVGNEETTRLPIRIEWKSGNQVDWLDGFFEDCRAQADSAENKAIGDFRPFAAGAVTNLGRELLVVEVDVLAQLWREARA